MAIWTTPKTDWHGRTDSEGVYTGDRFNASDFNRIKNNLQYLYDLSILIYEPYSFTGLGNDRNPGDFFYADEIMTMESDFTAIVENTLQRDYGESPTYTANGATMDYVELNRLESAMLQMYTLLTNQRDGLRHFTWNFGPRGIF